MTADHQDLEPHRGPAAALQQRVAHDLDVIAAPDEVRKSSADLTGIFSTGKISPESMNTSRNPPSATACIAAAWLGIAAPISVPNDATQNA